MAKKNVYALFVEEKPRKIPEDYSSFRIHHGKRLAEISEHGVGVFFPFFIAASLYMI
jgi:hypothetical protein